MYFIPFVKILSNINIDFVLKFVSMKKAHFYAYGVICNEQGDYAKEWGIVASKQIADFISANQEAEELVIHINSQGGDVDEGFAIHDLLSTSGKKITTVIEGMCASIATVVALAGSTREITENATFFIHNAWGFAGGDAEELQKYTDQVKAATDKIIDFYVSKTSGDREKIAALMDDDTSLTATQAKEMGFVTDIKVSVSAKAFTTKKFNTKKNDNSIVTEMKKEIQNLFAGLKKALNIKDEAETETQAATALDVETDKGVLHVESPKMEGVISVGDACTIDGAPAPSGDYVVQADESTVKIDDAGTVTSVEAKEKATDTEDVAALKAEIENLKKQNETIVAEKDQFEAETMKELEKIKSSITSNYTPPTEKKTFNKGVANTEADVKEEMKNRKATYRK